jgi:hypothetical protein
MNLLAASAHLANGSCGIGILSRDPAAASDALFNQYGRDPVVSGAQQGGVVEITVPALSVFLTAP